MKGQIWKAKSFDKKREVSQERISRSSDRENLERPLSFSLQKAGMAVGPILTVPSTLMVK